MSAARAASRIAAAFAAARRRGVPALVPYLTAGDPSLEASRDAVLALGRGGADIVEIGVPFSDPIADGPVNQRSAERALKRRTSLSAAIDLAARLRKDGAPPLVLFTYFNPIHRMGVEEFARRAGDAGVDGVLVTDLPPEEGEELGAALGAAGIDAIQLLSPTSSAERIERACAVGRGFLYFIARTGTTGVKADLPEALPAQVAAVRARTRLPVAVGFGISTPAQVRAVGTFADGVVVGSALVALIEEAGAAADLAARVEAFCRALRGA